MSNQPQQPQQINIELGEKEAEGIYSNLAILTHSPAEFVIDFTRVLPGVPKAKVHARIITTPQHAKLLLNALKDNIEVRTGVRRDQDSRGALNKRRLRFSAPHLRGQGPLIRARSGSGLYP
jgi:hypothetical protein